MKRTNKLVASILVLLMLLSSVMLALSSCNNKKNPSGDGEGGGDENTGKTESYSVTVVTTSGTNTWIERG